MPGLKSLARSGGLVRVYDFAFRNPTRYLRKLASDGGPIQRQRTESGHAAMRNAAASLPTIVPSRIDRGSRVHMLTGENFWHQSVYCIASLQMVMDERITPYFYSDGSLCDSTKTRILHVLPWAEFVGSEQIEAQLDAILPFAQFPMLRTRRQSYVHLRKLTDLHIFPEAWKLVLDADMLFFRPPAEMLKWFQRPHQMFMMDIKDNYGYPLEYLRSLVGSPLPARVNVGLYGLESSAIDWKRLERWCALQIEDFGPSYLQEQGLTAMLMAGKHARPLPEEDYVLMPKLREGRARRAVMHHYVHHSKRSYFQYCWREIDTRIRAQWTRN
jgi:hypothetical protein